MNLLIQQFESTADTLGGTGLGQVVTLLNLLPVPQKFATTPVSRDDRLRLTRALERALRIAEIQNDNVVEWQILEYLALLQPLSDGKQLRLVKLRLNQRVESEDTVRRSILCLARQLDNQLQQFVAVRLAEIEKDDPVAYERLNRLLAATGQSERR